MIAELSPSNRLSITYTEITLARLPTFELLSSNIFIASLYHDIHRVVTLPLPVCFFGNGIGEAIKGQLPPLSLGWRRATNQLSFSFGPPPSYNEAWCRQRGHRSACEMAPHLMATAFPLGRRGMYNACCSWRNAVHAAKYISQKTQSLSGKFLCKRAKPSIHG